MQLSVINLSWYGVALLNMRKFITQGGFLILLLFHFGCSGVQNRTAFGDGEGSLIFAKTDTTHIAVSTKENLKDLKAVEDHSENKELSIIPGSTFSKERNYENKLHQINQKIWFEPNRIPQKIAKKSKLLRDYKKFVNTISSKKSPNDSSYLIFLLIGLILAVIGYILILSPEQGWFGFTFAGGNLSGCFAILIGLALMIAALVLFIIGLVVAFSA